MHLITKIFRNLLSFISACFFSLNLAFWMWPMFAFALIKLLLGRINAVTRFCNLGLEICYRAAARINSLWMLYVVGVEINVQGDLPDHPSPIIVVNHQSWFDIPVMHHVITGHGIILKFLIKKQLIYVPIVGWMCYALNFPRLDRGSGPRARKKDFAAIESASSTLTNERGGLLIYAEGTRFTHKKHADQKSPYKHLLMPKPGGLKVALDAVTGDTPVVDVTVIYPHAPDFWRGLGGSTKNVKVIISTHKASDISDPRSWLMDRWQEKDALLEGAF